MEYIDPIGNDIHIISSNAPVNSYDFVDQSDTFKYVIATTVSNLVRNYNSKTNSEIVFRRDTMWNFQILFPTGEIITYRGWFHIQTENYNGMWNLRAFVPTETSNYSLLGASLPAGGITFPENRNLDMFLNVLRNSLLYRRHLLKIESEPSVQICENLGPNVFPNSLLRMCKFIDKKYVYSLLCGTFRDLITENNLHEILENGADEAKYLIGRKFGNNQVFIMYTFETNCFNLVVVENGTNIYNGPCNVIYDSTKDKLILCLDTGFQFIYINDNLENLVLPSALPAARDMAIDEYADYTAILHLFRLFIIFINRYRDLFHHVNDLSPARELIDIYSEIQQQLIGFEAFPEPRLPTTVERNIYISRHPDVISQIHRSLLDSVYSFPNHERIIIKKNDVIHLSIFKYSLQYGEFHLTNECFQADAERRVFFKINALNSILVNDTRVIMDILAERLLGNIRVWTREGARRMRGKTLDDIKELVCFFYRLVTRLISENPTYFTISES
jgi:hypothetical protein